VEFFRALQDDRAGCLMDGESGIGKTALFDAALAGVPVGRGSLADSSLFVWVTCSAIALRTSHQPAAAAGNALGVVLRLDIASMPPEPLIMDRATQHAFSRLAEHGHGADRDR
jgi:hypothetical protein